MLDSYWILKGLLKNKMATYLIDLDLRWPFRFIGLSFPPNAAMLFINIFKRKRNQHPPQKNLVFHFLVKQEDFKALHEDEWCISINNLTKWPTMLK